MTPWETFMSVFEPTTVTMVTALGVIFAVFFWNTMLRVTGPRMTIVWLPSFIFMVATGAGRYVDGSLLWPAWIAATCLWTWAVLVSIGCTSVWRQIRKDRA